MAEASPTWTDADRRRARAVVLLQQTGLGMDFLQYTVGMDPPVCRPCIYVARARRSADSVAQRGM